MTPSFPWVLGPGPRITLAERSSPFFQILKTLRGSYSVLSSAPWWQEAALPLDTGLPVSPHSVPGSSSFLSPLPNCDEASVWLNRMSGFMHHVSDSGRNFLIFAGVFQGCVLRTRPFTYICFNVHRMAGATGWQRWHLGTALVRRAGAVTEGGGPFASNVLLFVTKAEDG